MGLYRRGSFVAWRCHFRRRCGQSRQHGESRDNRASITDIRFAPWRLWSLGPPVAPATVVPHVGRLRYLQDSCGGDLGLLYAVTSPSKPGLFVATLIGNRVTWYDLTAMDQLRSTFNDSEGMPHDLSLTSAALTSAHLLMLTSDGVIVTSSFSDPGGNFTFTRLQLRRNNSSAADRAKDELIHSPSCVNDDANADSVLLLLHSEQRYLLGRAPFARTDAWQDVRSLVPWPAGLASVSDVRYVWHRNAVLLGFAQGDQYKTLVLPLEKTGYRKRPPSSEHVTRPFVYLCPLTKKVYLLAGQVLVSIDGGATFERTLTNVTFGHVENCFTDLIHHHICVTKDLELVVMSLGSDEPAKISLKDVIDAKNITDVAKIALVMDRAGGVTVFGTGSSELVSHYFNIKSGLPDKYKAPCGYRLELLGGVLHASIIHLDLHDIITVEVEAREVYSEWRVGEAARPRAVRNSGHAVLVGSMERIRHVCKPDAALLHKATTWAVKCHYCRHGEINTHTLPCDAVTVSNRPLLGHDEGEPLAEYEPLIDLELSNPDIVQVERSASVRGGSLRLAVTVRPQSWTLRGVCSLTFRLPRASALCTGTARLVTFALLPSPNLSIAVNTARGADPKVERDVLRGLHAGDRSFIELPVNYRPPSDLGINIPTSENIYNADPSQPMEQALLIVHEVPQISWPAKLGLTMSIRERNGPVRPLLAPMYVTITELNNRSSWRTMALARTQ
ncbi:uncharacterized protein LOC119106980 [Pollicipes pollicipes]|uniref:uncharacterized protein LOC119106980 n=1 Tax=Pollicipes pollicipes TaxID=41117 RepID=UPI001884D3DD|nr:uncharacterized protein LOC119106980 [Pollicipes pollicipes]